MRTAAILLTLIISARAAEWQSTLTPRRAGAFPPPRAAEFRYEFGWAGISAGQAEVSVQRKPTTSELHVKGATIGLARTLWRLDAEAKSVVDLGTLLTTRVVQTEQYSDETRKTTIVFSSEGASRTRTRVPANADSGKTKRFKFAPVRDLYGSLLFVRSQPLKAGNILRFVVYPNDSAYLAEVTVLGRETLKLKGSEWPAIKLSLRLQSLGKDLTVAPFRKFRGANAWLSDDADRLLLKVETDVMIGSVWMELRDRSIDSPAPVPRK